MMTEGETVERHSIRATCAPRTWDPELHPEIQPKAGVATEYYSYSVVQVSAYTEIPTASRRARCTSVGCEDVQKPLVMPCSICTWL